MIQRRRTRARASVFALAALLLTACVSPSKRTPSDDEKPTLTTSRSRDGAKVGRSASSKPMDPAATANESWLELPADSEDPLKEGLREAVAVGKPLVFVISAADCPKCSELERRLDEPAIMELLDGALKIRFMLGGGNLPANLSEAQRVRWVREKVPDLGCLYATKKNDIRVEHANGDQDSEDIANALKRCLQGNERAREASH